MKSTQAELAMHKQRVDELEQTASEVSRVKLILAHRLEDSLAECRVSGVVLHAVLAFVFMLC